MEWRRIATHGDPATISRHGHTSTLLAGRIFVYGGRTSDKDFIENIHILDPASNTWKVPRVRSNPPPRVFHTSNALEDSRLMIFGGSGPLPAEEGASSFYNDIWLYIADRTTWERCNVAGMPPPPRAAHTSVLLTSPRPSLIICGGTNSVSTFGDLWLCAIASPRWEALTTAG